MDAVSIMLLLGTYFLIGAIIDMYDSSTMFASFIFWPMIILIYACRGFIKIMKGDKK